MIKIWLFNVFDLCFPRPTSWSDKNYFFYIFHHYCRYLNQIWSAHRYSTLAGQVSRQILQGNLLRFTPTHHWQFWVVMIKCYIFSNRFDKQTFQVANSKNLIFPLKFGLLVSLKSIGISFKQAPWLKLTSWKNEDIGAAMFSSPQKLSTAHTGIKCSLDWYKKHSAIINRAVFNWKWVYSWCKGAGG